MPCIGRFIVSPSPAARTDVGGNRVSEHVLPPPNPSTIQVERQSKTEIIINDDIIIARCVRVRRRVCVCSSTGQEHRTRRLGNKRTKGRGRMLTVLPWNNLPHGEGSSAKPGPARPPDLLRYDESAAFGSRIFTRL